MQVSNAIEAGKLYRLFKTALRMRRLQKSKDPNAHAVEIQFDADLDEILADMDKGTQTDKVITVMSRPTLHEADKSHDPRQDEYIPGLGWVPKVKY